MKKVLVIWIAAGSLVWIACSKSDTPVMPAVTGYDISIDRPVNDTEVDFSFSLDKAPAGDVSFDYTTSSSSALAGQDFVAASGTLTIPAGSKSATIKVKIKGDSTRKANQFFYVDLSNPKNCKISTERLVGTLVNENGLYFPVDNAGYSTPSNYPGYTLVWSDEFSGRSINTSNWGFETGANGWGNHELETYFSGTRNAFVSQGNLVIEARAERTSAVAYSSARMITKGKKSFRYGRVDIRARVPKGKGIWPALWMLGDNIDQVGWPACGEIDIMELVGDVPNKVYGTLHWGPPHLSNGKNYVLPNGVFDDRFHVFSMDWDQNGITMYVDDVSYFSQSFASGGFPFTSNNFYFLFNVAVGGDWPGSPDGSTVFPQRMIVDYVRVFQK